MNSRLNTPNSSLNRQPAEHQTKPIKFNRRSDTACRVAFFFTAARFLTICRHCHCPNAGHNCNWLPAAFAISHGHPTQDFRWGRRCSPNRAKSSPAAMSKMPHSDSPSVLKERLSARPSPEASRTSPPSASPSQEIPFPAEHVDSSCSNSTRISSCSSTIQISLKAPRRTASASKLCFLEPSGWNAEPAVSAHDGA